MGIDPTHTYCWEKSEKEKVATLGEWHYHGAFEPEINGQNKYPCERYVWAVRAVKMIANAKSHEERNYEKHEQPKKL